MIYFGHFGNGITVWNSSIQDDETCDYKTIAHISINRNVHWRIKPDEVTKQLVYDFANTKNPKKSITQNDDIFNIKV